MALKESLKVLVVDDHSVVREGVAFALTASRPGTDVVQAATFSEAQSRLAAADFDVAVIDIHLADNSGLELMTWIRKHSRQMGIIIFSMDSHPEHILAAMDHGASGFLEKSAPVADLIDMIESAVRNPLEFRSRDLPRALTHRRSTSTLTPREIEILMTLPTGDTYLELAHRHFISESTLKSHLRSIYRKLNARNRLEAINQARHFGILPPIDPTSIGK